MLSRSDELILLAVWKLQHDAYGATVLEYLEKNTTETWSIAGVYAPLKRLSKLGLLSSRTGLPTAARGGRRKRLYLLTAQGVRSLEACRKEVDFLWQAVADLPIPS